MKNMVPLLNITALHAPIQEQLEAAALRVLRSGQYINGEDVSLFEKELAAYIHASNAIAVSSGTDALLATLMALNVQPGDKVITTTYTFFATAGAIVRLGAIPVFVDIDANGFNLDVSQIEALIDERTVGMIPVHLFGATADMSEICRIADTHGLWVVEDAAQAFGGRGIGTVGTAGIYSFFPAKNLGAAGDAGAVVTNDDELAERIRTIAAHGAKPKYHHHLIGGNFRMDTLQAALLRVKLPFIDEWNAARQQAAGRYDEMLSNIDAIQSPSVGAPPRGRPLNMGDDRGGDRGRHRDLPLQMLHMCCHVYNQYVIRFQSETIRDGARAALLANHIGCAVYYPLPLHLQPCFAELNYAAGDLPRSETAAQASLAIPMHPMIEQAEQEAVVEVLRGVV